MIYNYILCGAPLQHSRLKDPWGDCRDDAVSNYYDNETYTRFKCISKCETIAMADSCGCKDIHMQGMCGWGLLFTLLVAYPN